MRRHLPLLLGILSLSLSFTYAHAAENAALMKQLRSKYAMVQYHPECGGWYFIRYQDGKQTYYGFVDKVGNVVAQNATEYKMHKGYIELYILDPEKKATHDNWLLRMDEYQRALQKYNQVESDYKSKKAAYDAQVANAREIANQLWNQRRQEAYNRAVAAEKQRQAYAQANQQQASGWAGVLSGVLTAVGNGVSLATVGNNAANAVQFDPIFNEVKARNGLSSAPIKPYNPMPTKPAEPPTGYEWKTYPFLQPNPYTSIDYAAIAETGHFADVEKDGRYGLVDASLNEIYPCTNTTKVKDGTFLGYTRVKVGGQIGLLNESGHEVFKPIYTQIVALESNVMAKRNYMWGLYSKSGASLTGHIFSDYEAMGKAGFLGKVESNWGAYSVGGTQVLAPVFEKIENKSGYLFCRKNDLWGLYSTKGKLILPTAYNTIEPQNGYLFCEKNGKWGIYTSSAKELYPCQYDRARMEMVNGKWALYTQQRGLWGLVDFASGTELLPNSYSNISVIKLGTTDFFKVQKDNKQGLYDMKGLLLIPCEYDAIELKTVNNYPVFEARSNNKVSVFTRIGMPMLPLGRYTAYEYRVPFFYVKDGSKTGVVTGFGTELIACEYDDITYDLTAHCFTARQGSTYTLLDEQGQVVATNMVFKPVTFRPNYIEVIEPSSRKYAVCDYNGQQITKRKAKVQYKLGKIVDAYSKKHSLEQQNHEAKEQIIAAAESLERQTRQAMRQRRTFSYFAKNYVERIINDWQKKGEFEDTNEWKKRVNNETRAQKVYELTKAAQDEYIAQETARLKGDNISISGTYDADHQVFRITSQYAGKDILVPVARKDAEEFRNSFKSLRKEPKFFVENDRLGVAEYSFYMPSSKNVYTYNNKASLTYTIAKVDYDFDDVSISTDALNIGTSDVDVRIPETDKQNPNLYVFIFANESYQDAPRVDYAFNDGMTFKNYCRKTLGVPEDNVKFRPNATLSQMKFEINKIREIANNEVTGKDARFLIYYSGHGIPDEKGKSSYLLPVDGIPYDLANTAYKVSDLYSMLGEIACENTVILDACFSGATRAGTSLSNTKAVSVVTKSTPGGRTVALGASRENEVAHLYEEKAHSLFTYFLLKKLQDTKGNVSLGDLFTYTQKEVARRSMLMKKTQTPTAAAGPSASNWTRRKLQ